MATATPELIPAQRHAESASHPEPAPDRVDPGSHRCPECDHVLRVFGSGRHRVYFRVDDERMVDPVMDGACPACGHTLPGKSGA